MLCIDAMSHVNLDLRKKRYGNSTAKEKQSSKCSFLQIKNIPSGRRDSCKKVYFINQNHKPRDYFNDVLLHKERGSTLQRK